MKKFLSIAIVGAVLFSCKLSVNAAGLKDIFSADYYADSYEDLYAAFEYDEAKLFKHVKEYGLKEKRDVSPILDVVYYRETYPDLNAAFGDNWDAYVNHYFEYGIKEGRDNGTDFDVIRYVNSYADLREAFDEDYEALAKHYIQYGIKENRTMALKVKAVSSAPAVYQETTYDEEGRVSLVEVYSDSSKTTLLYTVEYEYQDDGSKTIIQTDAQGNMMKGEYYEANGNLKFRSIIEVIHEDNTMSGATYFYEEGKIAYENKVVRSVIVKEIEYYMHGGICVIYEYDQTTGNCIKEMYYDDFGVLREYIEYDPETGEIIVEKYYDEDGNETQPLG